MKNDIETGLKRRKRYQSRLAHMDYVRIRKDIET